MLNNPKKTSELLNRSAFPQVSMKYDMDGEMNTLRVDNKTILSQGFSFAINVSRLIFSNSYFFCL